MNDIDASMLADPLAYGDPVAVHRLLAILRAQQPVCYVRPDGVRPFWAVTRFEDVRQVEASPELFSAEPRTVLLTETLEQSNLKRFGDIHGVKTLVHMDGEQHRALRMIVREWFMPANIAKLREHVHGLAAQFVDRMRAMDGECDFAQDLAFWYPLRVVLQLIGIPECDEPKILRLAQQLFAPDAYATEDCDATAVFSATVEEMVAYFTGLAEQRRRRPCGDIASLLANAEIDGKPLDPFTLTSYFVILASAGHDTTSASLAGGMLALIEHPEQRRRLLDNPGLYANAADEMIRWVSPVKHFCRTALRDTELGGQAIRKDETVVLFFDSANRDASAFERPDEFDVTRSGSRHMAFGFGRHNCLGMHLARMEIELFMQQLLPALASVELAGTPTYVQSHFVSGLASLPIRYRFSD